MAELRAYAQQVITAGGNTSAVNATLKIAINNIWKSQSVMEIATAKQNGMDSIKEYEPIVYTAVDLGLPSGLKWASSNVGARNPEDMGLYFTWGDTEGHKKDYENFYNDYISKNLANIKSNLDLAHDAARANMGDQWRMPTVEEYQELIDYTTCEWNSKGIYLTSKINGVKIWLPAEHTTEFSYGMNYWASDLEYHTGNYMGQDYEVYNAGFFSCTDSMGYPVNGEGEHIGAGFGIDRSNICPIRGVSQSYP